MWLIRETLALAGLVSQLAIVGYFWRALPQRVPVHFGATGAVDSYGDRSTLIILAAVTSGLYVMLTLISFFPQWFNFPAEVTPENRGRLEVIAIAMIGWLKAEFTWLLAYIMWTVVQVALGRASGLGLAFLPITLAVVGVTIASGIVQMRRAA
jgi:hypothetical protein